MDKINNYFKRALVHLHSQNPPVTHRDLKLENVLLKDNKFKICDFGSCSFDQTDFRLFFIYK